MRYAVYRGPIEIANNTRMLMVATGHFRNLARIMAANLRRLNSSVPWSKLLIVG